MSNWLRSDSTSGPAVRLTSAEGAARMVTSVLSTNTLATLPRCHAVFLPIKLIHESAFMIRGSMLDGFKRSVIVCRVKRVKCLSFDMRILTDLDVCEAEDYGDIYDWCAELHSKQVLVCTPSILHRLLSDKCLTMSDMNILVIDSCHCIADDFDLQAIMQLYCESPENSRPRILALTYPPFTHESNRQKYTIQNEEEIKVHNETEGNREPNEPNKKSNNLLDQRELNQQSNEIKINRHSNEIEMNRHSNEIEVNRHSNEIEMNRQSKCEIEVNKQTNDIEMNSHSNEIEEYKQLFEIIVNKQTNETELNEESKETEIDKQLNDIEVNKLSIEREFNNKLDLSEEIDKSINVRDKIENEVNDESMISVNEMKVIDETAACDFDSEFDRYSGGYDFVMYSRFEWKVCQLEKQLCCVADLAEDIDVFKRPLWGQSKPKETIVEYERRPPDSRLGTDYLQLESFMRVTTVQALEFLEQHRYEPGEIYDEEHFKDELDRIPSPTCDPIRIFQQFIYVLDELGPYGADKAAFTLLVKLEKLKMKIPYERHFLLLCLCTTVLVKIRCAADLIFQKYESDVQRIQLFCTPKMHRFIDILAQFKPKDETSRLIADSVKMTCQNLSGTAAEQIKFKSNNETSNLTIDGVQSKIKMTCQNFKSDFGAKNDRIKRVEIPDTDAMIDTSISVDNLVNINEITDFNISHNNLTKSDNIIECGFSENNILNDVCCHYTKSDNTTCQNSLRIDCKHVNLPTDCKLLRESNCPTLTSFDNVCKQDSKVENDMIDANSISDCPALSNCCERDKRKSSKDINNRCKEDSNTSDSASQVGMCKRDTTTLLNEIESCDFISLKARLEERVNTLECGLRDSGSVTPAQAVAHTEVSLKRRQPTYKGRGRSRGGSTTRSGGRQYQILSPDMLCAVVFIREPLVAKILFMLVAELTRTHPDLAFISAQYSAAEFPDPEREPKDYEKMRRKQEEVLKKFRMHECNLLLATNALEDGIDLPRCNFVMRWDEPESYFWASWSRGRARGVRSAITTLTDRRDTITAQATYMYLDTVMNRKCGCGAIDEPPLAEELEADQLSRLIRPYTTDGEEQTTTNNAVDTLNTLHRYRCPGVGSVDLNNAISLINRYCSKLPSDTFTRLTPRCDMERVLITRDNHQIPMYICTIRLPVNSPVKYNIVGHPMRTRSLARRVAALQACRILHKSGELDNQLTPIGKENFTTTECELYGKQAEDNTEPELARPGTTKRRQYYYKRTAWSLTDCEPVVQQQDVPGDTRPSGENSESEVGVNLLYALECELWCPLPERYNTRGRRIHAPQHSTQALAILTSRHIRKIPTFPVYTRSGEVRVNVTPVCNADVTLTHNRVKLIKRFMHFLFSDVLRIRRRGMRMSDQVEHNNYYIVPTRKVMDADGNQTVDIDWSFLDLIYNYTETSFQPDTQLDSVVPCTEENNSSKLNGTCDVDHTCYSIVKEKVDLKCNKKVNHNVTDDQCKQVDTSNEGTEFTKNNTPRADVKEEPAGAGRNRHGHRSKREPYKKKMDNPFLKPGEVFQFDSELYRDAVVTPWYRNQDQPQYFLVAEICWQLTVDSAFPSSAHATFRDYYSEKYNVTITQANQPLLDVDHTSGRLNLLTPRYVNRKGVALPVSSERTRRARRERLDQKQILVPELCRRHPFAAPLWSAAVALPCILYRINALLIADEIRRAVAIEVGLGIPDINEETMPGFQWEPLDFGWSLADVLKEGEKKEKDKDEQRTKDTDESIVNDGSETANLDEQMKAESEVKEELTLNDILQKKVEDSNEFEIGTWSNDMASSIPASSFMMDGDEMEPLPSNLTFCTSSQGVTGWNQPIANKQQQASFNGRTFSVADSDCSYMSSDFDTEDSDIQSSESEDDETAFCSSKATNVAMGVRIEYKTSHEAEAVEIEPCKPKFTAPSLDPDDEVHDIRTAVQVMRSGTPTDEHLENFKTSIRKNRESIIKTGLFIDKEKPIGSLSIIQPTTNNINPRCKTTSTTGDMDCYRRLFPLTDPGRFCVDGVVKPVDLVFIESSKRVILDEMRKNEGSEKLVCFSMADVDIDAPDYVDEKVSNVGFNSADEYEDLVSGDRWNRISSGNMETYRRERRVFDFDYQPRLEGHPGPNPSLILQALTMSNANDGINLERLETVGDSYLKFAITAYLYCARPGLHEGKLSHMRSRQVSNLNLYRLGRAKCLGNRMIASKFEPHDNWLPPCHKVPKTLAARTVDYVYSDPADVSHNDYLIDAIKPCPMHLEPMPEDSGDGVCNCSANREGTYLDNSTCFIPYNLITQHSIPDKSVADCVEALIGAYLVETGPRGALLFMSWLGIKVLPQHTLYVTHEKWSQRQECGERKRRKRMADSGGDDDDDDEDVIGASNESCWYNRPVGSLVPVQEDHQRWRLCVYGELRSPPSPLLRYITDPEGELEKMLSGYDKLEETLRYRFRDRSLLLQALTHASHYTNRLTDCYQRLEFLGDAVLDYLITRQLFEDGRRHSPGALTDLRSALVNNTIFATLAVRHGFHKYFRHMSPALNEVLTKYVRIQEENGHSISEEHYLIQEDEMEQAEDVEVPKALGDLFESIAGAIFLDSGMSLGAVWRSYGGLMSNELKAFSALAPKSPVRELLEAEPDTAKFGKPERLADGRRVRVCVEVFGRGTFKGIGRNYRIAKGTAARCALRHLREKQTLRTNQYY